MKRLLSAAILCAAVSFGFAETTLQLVFETADGSTCVFDSKGLEMTVSGSSLIVKNGAKTETLALADLSKMYFQNGQSGIENTLADDDFTGIEVFTLSGRALGEFESRAAAAQQLEPGIYVGKSANETFKFQVK